MSMSRDTFNKAFHEAVTMDFVDIPLQETDIEFTFSDKFLRKMHNLVAMQQEGMWRVLSIARRHIATIAIVMIGLFVTSCGIVQVVKYMHHDLYLDIKNEFIENGGELDMDAEFHKLSYAPEGFELASIDLSDGSKRTTYRHASGDNIFFLQDKTGECYSILTEESVTSETVTIDENKVVLFKNNKLIGAMWIEDGIFMEVLYFGGSDMEELKEIVEGVK